MFWNTRITTVLSTQANITELNHQSDSKGWILMTARKKNKAMTSQLVKYTTRPQKLLSGPSFCRLVTKQNNVRAIFRDPRSLDALPVAARERVKEDEERKWEFVVCTNYQHPLRLQPTNSTCTTLASPHGNSATQESNGFCAGWQTWVISSTDEFRPPPLPGCRTVEPITWPLRRLSFHLKQILPSALVTQQVLCPPWWQARRVMFASLTRNVFTSGSIVISRSSRRGSRDGSHIEELFGCWMEVTSESCKFVYAWS